MPTGKVKWYDAEKGFGFLSQESGPDVYVRAEALPEGTTTSSMESPSVSIWSSILLSTTRDLSASFVLISTQTKYDVSLSIIV